VTTLPDFFKAATRHDPYLCQRRLAEERPLPRLLESPDIRRSKSGSPTLRADPLPRLRPIGFRVEETRPAYRVRRRQRRLG